VYEWSELRFDDFLQVANGLADAIYRDRDEIETSRGLPSELIHALRESGLFSLWLPKSLGGPELTVLDFVRIIEAVSRADGSAGWCTAIGACYSRFAGYLAEPVAREIYGAGDAIVAGTLNPTGRAVTVPGGYRVSGQWAYGSGIGHSNWVVGNALVLDEDKIRPASDGSPTIRLMIFPKRDVEVLDTWKVAGLRGTGSHDFRVAGLFVPDEMTITGFGGEPTQPGRIYSLPLITVFCVSITGVPLGLARASIEALTELAESKRPMGSTVPLKDRSAIQSEIGRAEALLRSARSFLFEAVQEMWDAADDGEPSMRQRALVRLAAANVATTAKQVTNMMFECGGGTSLYEDGRLARCWRDAHAAAQHIALSSANFEMGGRVMLGMDPGTPRF
jgi:alkylation response protein AidB-like acyl-CoA dehydrogenase